MYALVATICLMINVPPHDVQMCREIQRMGWTMYECGAPMACSHTIHEDITDLATCQARADAIALSVASSPPPARGDDQASILPYCKNSVNLCEVVIKNTSTGLWETVTLPPPEGLNCQGLPA